MNKESREHLSSFIDGEISKETSRFLVRRLGADSELRETWTRYHLVRDCLRHQESDLAGIGLCGRVRQALENETPPVAPSRISAGWSKAVWLKPIAGMAIAASVALMAVMIVEPGPNGVSTPASELAASPAAESFVSPNTRLSSTPRPQQVSVLGGTGNSSRRMNSYLLRHYQVTGSTGGKGFVTFVPIVVTQSGDYADAGADSEGSLRGAQDGSLTQGNDSLDRANDSAQQ